MRTLRVLFCAVSWECLVAFPLSFRVRNGGWQYMLLRMARGIALIDKFIVTHLVRETSRFYGNRRFVTFYPKTCTGSYPEPVEFNRHPCTIFPFGVNITLHIWQFVLNQYEDVAVIYLVRVWVKWRDFVNTIMNLRFLKRGKFFWLTKRLSVLEEGQFSLPLFSLRRVTLYQVHCAVLLPCCVFVLAHPRVCGQRMSPEDKSRHSMMTFRRVRNIVKNKC